MLQKVKKMHVERWRQWKEFSSCGCCGSFYMSSPDNAKSTINTARRQRLTEEFVPFLTIYYNLSQFIDCPTGDSSVVQRRRLKSPPTEEFSLAAFVVHSAISASDTSLQQHQIFLSCFSLVPSSKPTLKGRGRLRTSSVTASLVGAI